MSHPAVGTVNTWPSLRCPERIFTLLLSMLHSSHLCAYLTWTLQNPNTSYAFFKSGPALVFKASETFRLHLLQRPVLQPSLSDFSHWLYSSLCTPFFFLFFFFGINYPQIWWVWNTNNMKVPQGFQFSPASLGASAHICIHVWGFYMRMSLGDLLLGESPTLLIYQLGECSQQPPGHSTLKTGSHH